MRRIGRTFGLSSALISLMATPSFYEMKNTRPCLLSYKPIPKNKPSKKRRKVKLARKQKHRK